MASKATGGRCHQSLGSRPKATRCRDRVALDDKGVEQNETFGALAQSSAPD
jgi:hypothetical protein